MSISLTGRYRRIPLFFTAGMTYLEGYGLAVFPAEKHGDGVCGEV
jgi:hypothetical protein